MFRDVVLATLAAALLAGCGDGAAKAVSSARADTPAHAQAPAPKMDEAALADGLRLSAVMSQCDNAVNAAADASGSDDWNLQRVRALVGTATGICAHAAAYVRTYGWPGVSPKDLVALKVVNAPCATYYQLKLAQMRAVGRALHGDFSDANVGAGLESASGADDQENSCIGAMISALTVAGVSPDQFAKAAG